MLSKVYQEGKQVHSPGKLLSTKPVEIQIFVKSQHLHLLGNFQTDKSFMILEQEFTNKGKETHSVPIKYSRLESSYIIVGVEKLIHHSNAKSTFRLRLGNHIFESELQYHVFEGIRKRRKKETEQSIPKEKRICKKSNDSTSSLMNHLNQEEPDNKLHTVPFSQTSFSDPLYLPNFNLWDLDTPPTSPNLDPFKEIGDSSILDNLFSYFEQSYKEFEDKNSQIHDKFIQTNLKSEGFLSTQIAFYLKYKETIDVFIQEFVKSFDTVEEQKKMIKHHAEKWFSQKLLEKLNRYSERILHY